MKKFTAFICLLITVIFTFNIFGCGNYASLDFICFNTQVYISVNNILTSSDENELKTTLKDFENSFSVSKNGDVASLNFAKANEKIYFGADSFALINYAKELYSFTNGYFNPAVLPISRLWKLSSDTFDNKIIKYTPPSSEAIQAVLSSADFSKVNISGDGVYKTDSSIAIDLGGIAKGYATDYIKTFLSDRGVKEGYISVGGSSLYIFSVKEDLGIKHPRIHGSQILKVANSIINDSYISTSGDYIRYYMGNDGKRYSHIINGFTGYPAATGLSSVTVIAGKNAPENLRSAAATDALSTALMLMDTDSAIDFINNKLAGIYVFIVNTDEKKIFSNTQLLTILDDKYSLSII